MKNTLSKLAVLIATTFSLSTVAFEAAAANSIVGGWHKTGDYNFGGTNSVLMFLNDGTYFHVMDSTTETDGTNGMEYGTYNYNEATSQMSFNTLIDTNGGWGANSGAGSFSFINQNTINIPGDYNNVSTFSRITSDSNPIVGSWLVDNERNFVAVISFLNDGTYFFADNGSPDETGWNGMERGTYNYNQATGELDFTSTQIDTNGDRGPANNGIICCPNDLVTFSSYNLLNAFSISENSTSTWTRVAAVPEADTSAMLLMGAGVMGFMARRRKQTTA
jgi:hypothetical protein